MDTCILALSFPLPMLSFLMLAPAHLQALLSPNFCPDSQSIDAEHFRAVWKRGITSKSSIQDARTQSRASTNQSRPAAGRWHQHPSSVSRESSSSSCLCSGPDAPSPWVVPTPCHLKSYRTPEMCLNYGAWAVISILILVSLFEGFFFLLTLPVITKRIISQMRLGQKCS